jgi:hypothetical protein
MCSNDACGKGDGCAVVNGSETDVCSTFTNAPSSFPPQVPPDSPPQPPPLLVDPELRPCWASASSRRIVDKSCQEMAIAEVFGSVLAVLEGNEDEVPVDGTPVLGPADEDIPAKVVSTIIRRLLSECKSTFSAAAGE